MTTPKRLLTGHEVEQVSEEELKELGLDIFNHGMVRIKPEGWLYPGTAPAFLDRIYNMEFRPDDVLLMTFPKCGSTWLQEILWTMLHNPKLDNPKAEESVWLRAVDISLDMAFDLKPFGGKPPESYLEKFKQVCPGKNQEEGVCLHLVDAAPSPRVMKSHYSFTLLPKDILDRVKVIYLTRNPKDMAVSQYHFFDALKVFPYEKGMDSLFKGLLNNQTWFAPFWPHVKEGWEKRHHPNVLFLFYEELKADIMKQLGRINEFLGAGLSQETLEAVARHTSFSSMKSRGEPLKDEVFEKKDESEVKFYRKGATGDWKNHFSPEMQKEFDQWTKENLADSDLSLSWALAQ